MDIRDTPEKEKRFIFRNAGRLTAASQKRVEGFLSGGALRDWIRRPITPLKQLGVIVSVCRVGLVSCIWRTAVKRESEDQRRRNYPQLAKPSEV